MLFPDIKKQQQRSKLERDTSRIAYFYSDKPEVLSSYALTQVADFTVSYRDKLVIIYHIIRNRARLDIEQNREKFQTSLLRAIPEMIKRAYHRGLDAYDREDVTQDVIEKALRLYDRHGFRATGKDYHNSVSAWLCMMVQNKSISLKRKQKVRNHEDVDNTPDRAAHMQDTEVRTEVHRALEGLNKQEQKLIQLVHFDSTQTVGKVALMYNCTVNELKARLKKIYDKLQKDDKLRELV